MQQRLGKYTLGGLIGSGGMGAVYELFHPQLRRPVAIKVLGGALAADAAAQQRFLREAQTAAVLSHPGIINILDVDEDDGRPFIVMEKLEDGSLAARLARGPLAPDEALRITEALAEALAYAHRQGVVHRDIKPANVLLRPDGTPVLADFGLARAAAPGPADRLTATGALMGTIAYMAPEQFAGAAPDARSDIYALGVLLYELLAGRLPFEGDTAQVLLGHMQREPPPIRPTHPAVPTDAERLALRMLAKDPAARPQTAAEVARELRGILERGAATGATMAIDQSGLPRLAPGAATRRASRRRGRWTTIGAVAAALVVLAAIGVLGRPARTRLAVEAPTRSIVASEADATDAPGPQLTPVRLAGLTAPRLSGAEPAGAGPERFSVGGVSTRADNSLWFFGEVRNDGDAPRESVEIRILLLDAAGKELLSATGYADRSFLNPGDISPFSVLFTDKDGPLPAYHSYRAEVRSRPADMALRTTVRQVRVDEDLLLGKGEYSPSLEVTGRVWNDADVDAQYTEVIVVFYDADGLVVGIGKTYADDGSDDRLAPGADAPFRISFVVLSGEPASYYAFAEAKDFR